MALGIPVHSACGILELMWHFTAKYALQGDIGRHPNHAIAKAVGWQGDADQLIRVLVDCGWLDVHPRYRLLVHHWFEHADQTVYRVLSKRGIPMLASAEYIARLRRKKSRQKTSVMVPICWDTEKNTFFETAQKPPENEVSQTTLSQCVATNASIVLGSCYDNASQPLPLGNGVAVSGESKSSAEISQSLRTMSGSPTNPTPRGFFHQDAKVAIAWLNEHAGKHFRETATNLKLASARLREPGITIDGVKVMIGRQVAMWRGTRMEEYLRPETLFGKEKFGGYYDQRDQPIVNGHGIPPHKELELVEKEITAIKGRATVLSTETIYQPNDIPLFNRLVSRRKEIKTQLGLR